MKNLTFHTQLYTAGFHICWIRRSAKTLKMRRTIKCNCILRYYRIFVSFCCFLRPPIATFWMFFNIPLLKSQAILFFERKCTREFTNVYVKQLFSSQWQFCSCFFFVWNCFRDNLRSISRDLKKLLIDALHAAHIHATRDTCVQNAPVYLRAKVIREGSCASSSRRFNINVDRRSACIRRDRIITVSLKARLFRSVFYFFDFVFLL